MSLTTILPCDGITSTFVAKIETIRPAHGERLLRAHFGDDLFITFTLDSITYREPLTLADLNRRRPLTLAELNDHNASYMELNDHKLFTAGDLKNLKHFTVSDLQSPTAFRRLIANQLVDEAAVWEASLATCEAVELLDDAEWAEAQPFDEITEAQLKAVELSREASSAQARLLDGTVSFKDAELLNKEAFEALEFLYEMTWEDRLKAAEPLARSIEACLPQEFQDLPEDPADWRYGKRYRETKECIAIERLEEQICNPPTHEEVLAQMEADKAEMKARLDRGERVPRDWFDELRDEQKTGHDKRLREAMKLTRALLGGGVDPESVPLIVADRFTDLDEDEIQNMLATALKQPRPTSTGEQTAPPFDPASFKPIRERGYVPPAYLVDGLISLGGINVFVGDFGSGKSIGILDMLRAIANGTHWAGRETGAPRPVWILDRENQEGYLLSTADLLDLRDGDTGLFKHTFLWLASRDFQFSGVDDPRLIAAVEACEPGLEPIIVFDSFRAWLDGDENSAADVRAHWTKCRLLTDRRATVVTPHHNNKQGSFSGSTDVGAGTDMFWAVESLDKPKLDRLNFKPIRARGVAGVEFTVKFNYEKHTFEAMPEANWKSERGERNVKLAELLKTNPGLTKTKLENKAMSAGIATRVQVQKWISYALSTDEIVNRGTDEKTVLFLREDAPERDEQEVRDVPF